MKWKLPSRLLFAVLATVTLTVVFWFGCQSTTRDPVSIGLPDEAMKIAQDRDLTPDNINAALSTYVPTGRHDDYVMFASGGHSGQVIAIGMPSMRILKGIGVFTPESWQGYGYGVQDTALAASDAAQINGKPITWADTHHPALSETNGDYDGQFLFINDKASGRIAVIDLRDFETKQIVKNPLFLNDHGAAMVTPNTEYIIEGAQYAMPLGNKYAPLSQYKEKYRGLITFWKFDRSKGRIQKDQSFSIELPPYWQDLADSGKVASDGWVFLNSFNTEMATGGVELGNPPFEAGASENDMDYLHIINRIKAIEIFKAGKAKKINGFSVISIETAVKEGILYMTPEPKSPHGCDVSPSGKYIVVSGKLDPHVTIYHIDKIKKAIADQDYEGTDEYNIPILRFDSVVEAQVEVGLGPLHSQFDNQGYVYTSLFLDSAIARWTLGPEAKYKAPEQPWTLVQQLPVHYNVGHLVTAEGDTVSPDGKYAVSLNKWAVDRFLTVGPLVPQNLQLIDINQAGENMKLLYDMPLGIGEPHYAQIIKADKLNAWEVYPEVGWDTLHQKKHPKATDKGKITVKGNTVEVDMTAMRSHYEPERIEVEKGQRVIWRINNLERTYDATHGFALPGYNITSSIEPGETVTLDFIADQEGVFTFYCTEFCSALHLEMCGYFLVKP